jgi:hypothetical protein
MVIVKMAIVQSERLFNSSGADVVLAQMEDSWHHLRG